MVTTHPSYRLWYTRRKFKTKPMTKEEVSAVRVEFTTLTPEVAASKRRKTELCAIKEKQTPIIDKGKSVAIESEKPARIEAQEETDQETRETSKEEANEVEQKDQESENELTKNTCETTHAHTSMESTTITQRYKDFAKSLAHVEKGFDDDCVNSIPCVGNIIKFFGWEKLCAIPASSNLTWVREFYTAASMTESTELVVRGQHVSYSPNTINAYFSLNPPPNTEFARIMTNPNEQDLANVLETIAQPTTAATTWQEKLPANGLTFEAGLWFHYLTHSLIPTTHDSFVSLDRMKLLHCILTKKTVNVGMVISSAIAICAKKRVRKLFFPALITGLMREAGVGKMKDDEMLNEKVSIDKVTIESIRRHYKPPQPPPPLPPRVAASDVAVTLVRAIKEQQGEILGKIKVLEAKMEKQEESWVKGWRYENKRKRAGKKLIKP